MRSGTSLLKEKEAEAQQADVRLREVIETDREGLERMQSEHEAIVMRLKSQLEDGKEGVRRSLEVYIIALSFAGL